jgi:hypothetical protein
MRTTGHPEFRAFVWPAHKCSVAGLAVLGLIASTTVLHAATLTVGPGQKYKTIAAAVNASHDGDTINVMAGLYVNDFSEIRTKITLQSVGGMARVEATENLPNEKGIFIVDTDVTISGFELFNAHIPVNEGANGAGIRYQGGNLTINNCYIHNNQDGLLGGLAGSVLTITNSEFAYNGNKTGPDAGYTHNLYVGPVSKLDIENGYFHNAYVGHEIKSRAAVTIINNTRVADRANGTASYGIDLPNGGIATITNVSVQKGVLAQNPIAITFGEEGPYAASSLLIKNTIIENNYKASTPVGIKNLTSAVATVSNIKVWGLTAAELTSGPVTLSGVSYATTEPLISWAHPWTP